MKIKILYSLFFFAFTIFWGNAQEKKMGQDLNDQISIYPNPTTTQKITIQTESNTLKEVEIFDMLGKKVLNASFLSREKELYLNSFQAGVYIVKIKDENGSATRKLIVK